MSRCCVKSCVEQYQRARLAFIQTISGFADKAHTSKLLAEFHILDLIAPLLSDKIPSIQHAALATLTRLVCTKRFAVEDIVGKGLVKKVVKHFDKKNKHYKATALVLLTYGVQQDERVGQVIQSELGNIILGLQDLDSKLRASTALALGNMAKDNKELADCLVQCGAICPLTRVLANPELSVKCAAVFALASIAKHNVELAEEVAEGKVIPLCIKALNIEDAKLKAEVFLCLASIAKHSPHLASRVADGKNEDKVISVAVEHLHFPDETVQKHAALLLRDMCKHNLRLANQVVNSGALESFISMIGGHHGPMTVLPAIMALGYMASQSTQISEHIIALDGIHTLQKILAGNRSVFSEAKNCEEQLQVTAAWTLGQIGKHSVDFVAVLCEERVLSALLEKAQADRSENLQSKCKNILQQLIPKCDNCHELEQLFLVNACEELTPTLLAAFARILPCDLNARRSFISSKCLSKFLQITENPNIIAYQTIIYACFPENIIDLESPGYFERLVKRLDKFKPVVKGHPRPCPTPSTSTVSLNSEDEGLEKGKAKSLQSMSVAPKSPQARKSQSSTTFLSRSGKRSATPPAQKA